MKKAQFWLDFAMGTLIFISIIIMFFTTLNNVKEDTSGDIELLGLEARSISSMLLSKGLPQDWDLATVIQIGLKNEEGRLSQNKLNNFYDLDYYDAKKLFGMNKEYYIYLRDEENLILPFGTTHPTESVYCGIGYSNERGFSNSVVIERDASTGECKGVDLKQISTENLITISRHVIYQQQVCNMVIHLWE